jgi:hypothetical protein
MARATTQTQRDADKTRKRIEETSLYKEMEQFLRQWKKSLLLWEAMTYWRSETNKGRPIAKVGRVENRRRDALVCWFCENHPEVRIGKFATGLTKLTSDFSSIDQIPATPSHSDPDSATIPTSPVDGTKQTLLLTADWEEDEFSW